MQFDRPSDTPINRDEHGQDPESIRSLPVAPRADPFRLRSRGYLT